MTDYERGRRDAVRDVIAHLMLDVGQRTHVSDRDRRLITEWCREIEGLTAIEPDGRGMEHQ